MEVAREELERISEDLSFDVSLRDMSVPPPVSSTAAASGLAPNVSDRHPLTPNMVYDSSSIIFCVFLQRCNREGQDSSFAPRSRTHEICHSTESYSSETQARK